MILSFIIPVYNCEEYIANCISSILCSSLTDYEIILINDGSRDNSLSICEEFAAKNTNIQVINQKNKGASSARNAGLDIAQGEYIWFVDADDSICSENVTELLQPIHSGYDIINFKYNRIEVSSSCICQEYPLDKKVSDGIDLIERSHALFLWDKLFRRDIIGNVRFAEDTINIEDMYFNVCVLPSAKKNTFLDVVLYNYCCLSITSTSRSRTKRNLIKLSQDTLFFQEKLIEDVADAKDTRMKNMLEHILYSSLSGHLFSLMNFYNFKRVQKVIKIYKKWRVYPIPLSNNFKANIFSVAVNNAFTLRLVYMMIVVKNKL